MVLINSINMLWCGGFLLLFFLATTATTALGQQEANRLTAQELLSIRAPNPAAYLHSVAFKNTIDFGAPNGSAYFLNVIPIIPMRVGSWDVVNRTSIPIINVPGFRAGSPEIPTGTPGDGAFGLGDINYTAYISPSSDEAMDWGIGPSITFPTATDDQLGAGKWSAGPAVAGFFIRKPWVSALQVRQLWSFAGDTDRVDVDQLVVQPTILYGLGNNWALVTDLVITANWKVDAANRWTVPLGGGVSRFLYIGNQPMIVRLDAYYYVEKPVSAPDWSINLLFRLLFPR
jgi:hypothetical protein